MCCQEYRELLPGQCKIFSSKKRDRLIEIKMLIGTTILNVINPFRRNKSVLKLVAYGVK